MEKEVLSSGEVTAARLRPKATEGNAKILVAEEFTKHAVEGLPDAKVYVMYLLSMEPDVPWKKFFTARSFGSWKIEDYFIESDEYLFVVKQNAYVSCSTQDLFVIKFYDAERVCHSAHGLGMILQYLFKDKSFRVTFDGTTEEYFQPHNVPLHILPNFTYYLATKGLALPYPEWEKDPDKEPRWIVSLHPVDHELLKVVATSNFEHKMIIEGQPKVSL